MSRRRPRGLTNRQKWSCLLLSGVVIVLVVLLVVGLLVGERGGAPTDTAEQQSGEIARGSPSVTGPAPTGTAQLGSGGGATSSWYQLAFTDPRYPDDPADHHGGLDDQLVALYDRATQTLDVAIYDFDLADVADAMARAQARGVRVRMVTDSDTLGNDNAAIQASFATVRRAGIPIVDDQRSALMHDKFSIVDGEWVASGSWNYTDGDTYHLNNNLIVIHSTDLAANYTTVFERMFTDRQFGPSDAAAIPHPTLSIDGASVQNCFSPSGNCARLVVNAVESAERDITFMAFSFTDEQIGAAMLDRAQAGVRVQGVFETTGSGTRYSQYGPLADAGLEVYTDGNPWVMHHKVIVIDDHLVVFGSYNFSANANDSNDENLLIVDDAALASAFEAEFARVLAVARNPPAT